MTTAVIIPAHQEEATIGRCLTALLVNAQPGEFRVIVAANGCSDRTAEVARVFPDVQVIELAEGSKVKAVNAALDLAAGLPVIHLDADLALSTGDARKMAAAVRGPGVRAAIGRMHVDASRSIFPVRQFYKAWAIHPYFDQGKFGGAYALSAEAQARIGKLPPVTNDDEWVSRQFAPAEVTRVEGVSFTAVAPVNWEGLIKVRSRVARGNRQLQAMQVGKQSGGRRFARRVASRPSLWLGFAVFCLVTFIARRRVASQAVAMWERDDSSRRLASQA